MKKTKKLLSFLLAAAMVLSMGMTAYAVNETPAANGNGTTNAQTSALPLDKTISVTHLEKGDSVSYYRVLQWNPEVKTGWEFADGFKDTGLTVEQVLAGITQEQADKIASASNATPITDPAGSIDDNGTWSADDPGAGLYMVLATAAESGTVYNPAFVGADYYDTNNTNTISIEAFYKDSAVAKKSTIPVDKEAGDPADSTVDSNVGDIVPFTVTTTIPVFLKSYRAPFFKITDSLTDGLKLVIDGDHPLALKYGTTTVDKSDDNVTITAENGGSEIKAEFKSAYLSGNETPVSVKLTYYAEITSAAETNVDPEENTVKVEYSNGPDGSRGVIKDVTTHYTFSLGANILGKTTGKKKAYELVKAGVDSDGNYVVQEVALDDDGKVKIGALSGATFGLYTDKDAKNLYKNSLYKDGAKFTTEDDGIITFKGLDAGTYYFKEIDGPSGFIKDTAVHEVVITPKYTEKTVTETDPDTKLEVTYKVKTLDDYTVAVDGKTSTFTFTNDGPTIVTSSTSIDPDQIDNTKGAELPATGGIGTTLFYIIGSVLVIGAGVVLVAKRRMNSN